MHGKPESHSKSQPPKSRVPASPGTRTRRTITAKNLRTLPVGDWTDAAVRGLTLRVRPSGARTWALRYRVRQGRNWSPQRRLHFGEVGGPLALDLVALGLAGDFLPPRAVLGLSEARQVAQALLGLAARGSDPLALLSAATEARERQAAEEARRQAHGLASLGELLDRYIAFRADPPKGAKMPKGQKQGPIRPATLTGWESLARGALAPLRDHDPATLTVEDVENWHQHVGATRGTVAANRGLELLATMYTWAMATRGEDGQRLLSASPCGPVRAFDERPRSRVLDSGELAAVWPALEGEPLGDAIRLLLWTGARKNEATGAEWREVDFGARLWTVPAERSKTGEARKVPLSAPALAMLRHRREGDPTGRWVFPSTVAAVGPVGSLQALLRRVQKRSEVTGWTLHDLRRVVRSGLSALGVAPSVAEFILGHLPPRLVRTYDRHEPIAEAAAALEAWAGRLASYVDPEAEGGAVVAFTRERAQ
jgi:integrase